MWNMSKGLSRVFKLNPLKFGLKKAEVIYFVDKLYITPLTSVQHVYSHIWINLFTIYISICIWNIQITYVTLFTKLLLKYEIVAKN